MELWAQKPSKFYYQLRILNMSNFKQSFLHGIVSVLLFAIPLVLAHAGAWQGLTIGGVLNLIYHWLFAAYGSGSPAM